jgi:ribosome-binding factor A
MSRRMEKVADLLQAEIADLLHRQVKHPVIAEAMISITRVAVAADLGRARVHVSVMGPEQEQDDVLTALQRVEPFLHRELVKRLRMRRIPRLRFIADHSIAEGDRIAALLRDVAHAEGRD